MCAVCTVLYKCISDDVGKDNNPKWDMGHICWVDWAIMLYEMKASANTLESFKFSSCCSLNYAGISSIQINLGKHIHISRTWIWFDWFAIRVLYLNSRHLELICSDKQPSASGYSSHISFTMQHLLKRIRGWHQTDLTPTPRSSPSCCPAFLPSNWVLRSEQTCHSAIWSNISNWWWR